FTQSIRGFAKKEEGENICLFELRLAAKRYCWRLRSSPDNHINLVSRQCVPGYNIKAGIYWRGSGEHYVPLFQAEFPPIKRVPPTHGLDSAGEEKLFCGELLRPELPCQFDCPFLQVYPGITGNGDSQIERKVGVKVVLWGCSWRRCLLFCSRGFRVSRGSEFLGVLYHENRGIRRRWTTLHQGKIWACGCVNEIESAFDDRLLKRSRTCELARERRSVLRGVDHTESVGSERQVNVCDPILLQRD